MAIDTQPIETQEDLIVPKINNSKREYKTLVLKNKLKVLLVSDPQANVSSASIDVQVGSLEDPVDQQGLFHFLEHMLFLGTKKYPEVGEYSKYLKSHNGGSNAYTSEENTNYHFQVSHEAFEGAVDRFSQFFISPLFNENETEKERNNVHSEHLKNIPNDYWRNRQLLRSHFIEGHPSNHFSTGNKDTLGKTTRDQLITQYKKYYSSNLMALCIHSNKSISELTELATKYFADIPNLKAKAPVYPEKFLDSSNSLRIIHLKPKSDIRKLGLFFALPNTNKYKNYQPTRVVGNILGHEGKGSLTSMLKKDGLITSLSAGGYKTGNFGQFQVDMNLTEKGLEQKDQIISLVFSMIKLMKSKEIPDYIYKEQSTLAKISFENAEEEEGTDYVSHMSALLNEYPMHTVLTAPNLFADYNQEAEDGYKLILNQLIPENCLITVASRKEETDKTEKYYGVEYSLKENKALYDKVKAIGLTNSLTFPEPNPFIPDSTELLAPRPYQIIGSKQADIWFLQDLTFNLPKGSVKFEILSNKVRDNARNEVLAKLYRLCLDDDLNEDIYPMQLAGLSYSLNVTSEAIELKFSGYSDKLWDFVTFISNRLKSVQTTPEQFGIVKEKYKRQLKNVEFSHPYEQALMLYHELVTEKYNNTEAKLLELETINLEELKKFVNASLYKETFIRGIVYGNLEAKDAYFAVYTLIENLETKPLKELPLRNILQIQNEGNTLLSKKNQKANNSAILDTYHFGLQTPSLRGAAQVLSKIINNPYYHDMRTVNHLGYIVWSYMDQLEHNLSQNFIIQSGEFSADKLLETSDQFLQTFRAEIEKLSEDEIEDYKQAVIDRKLEKPKSIAEISGIFFYRCFEKDKDFDHVKTDIAAVKALTKKDILDLYDQMLSKKSQKRITTLIYANEHSQMIPDTDKNKILEIKKNGSFKR